LALILDGNNTPTLGGVGYGDGTELAFSAAGTAGQVLTSAGGAAPTWATVSTPSPVPTIVVLTSGTSWTAPAGVTKIKVTATGGGGGGGNTTTASTFRQGGSGGAGGTAISIFTVVPATSYVYAIGAGGGTSGGTGGNTTFTVGATTITGFGGVGGVSNVVETIAGVAGGAATNGDINLSGGGSGSQEYNSGTGLISQSGGASYWGGGGKGVDNTPGSAGVAGGAYGSGGSGAVSTSPAANLAGGAGASGVVVIEY
jgi:hypothetical protein